MTQSNPTLRDAIENKVLAFGRELQDLMKDQVPSVFDRRHWEGRILDWAMGDPDFKTDLFRFVDVLPSLSSTKQIASHVREYLLKEGRELPALISAALKAPKPKPEISVGGPEVFSQHEIGDLAFAILGREPRYGHISSTLVRRLARWIRPLNRNASALAMMFSSLGDHDAVAPAVGSRHLEDFYRELGAA